MLRLTGQAGHFVHIGHDTRVLFFDRARIGVFAPKNVLVLRSRGNQPIGVNAASNHVDKVAAEIVEALGDRFHGNPAEAKAIVSAVLRGAKR